MEEGRDGEEEQEQRQSRGPGAQSWSLRVDRSPLGWGEVLLLS